MFFIPFSSSYCQVLSIKNYSVKDGLPSNDVGVIYQDSRGYMWFGTTDGLSVFDGRTFTNYTTNDGLPHNFISEIFEDRISPGTMWILAGGHVCKFSRGSFFTYALQVVTVTWMHQDHEGVIWCGTERGAVKIKGDSAAPFRPAMLDTGIVRITEIGDTLLWFGIDRAIVSYSLITRDFTKIQFRQNSNYGIIWSMLGDTDGNLWVATSGGYVVQVRNRQVIQTRQLSPLGTWLAKDGKKQLWGAGYNGIASVPTYEFASAPCVQYTTDNGLLENTIRSILFDREGNLWLGGRDKGIVKLSARHTFRFPIGTVEDYSLVHNPKCAVSDLHNHIWTITNRGLQEFWRDDHGKWKNYIHPFDDHPDVHSVGSLFCDSRDRLWVMRGIQGEIEFPITCYDLTVMSDSGSSLLTKVKTAASRPPGLGQFCFLVDKKGAIWQSISSLGIIRLDSSNSALKVRLFGQKDGVPTNYIRSLYEDHNGNIWGGSYSSGVIRVSLKDTSTWSIAHFNIEDGLPSSDIWSILEDRSRRILVGTGSAGLAVFEGDSIRSISTKNGLPSNAITCMTEDSYGRLWIGTSIGMAYEDHPGSKRFIQDQIFTGSPVHCCGTTRSGLLWYLTATDLFIYDYATDGEDHLQPPTYITGLKINGNSETVRSPLELTHEENTFEIDFIGISFQYEGAIRYRYHLIGADHKWHGPTINSSITYGHLDPGSYRFEVKAINIDGVESSNPASLAITILPPYWETAWFRAGLVALILSIGPGIYILRVSQLKKERTNSEAFSRQLIEAQELERKRLAGELHDGLGQDLIVIINRAQLALRSPASGPEQIQEVVNTASRLIESTRDMAFNLSPYHLEQIGLVESIKSMVEKVGQLSDIVISLDTDYADYSLTKEMELHVYRMVQECLNNIVKHAQAANAGISLKRRDGTLEIVVHDDGRGFSASSKRSKTDKRFGLTGLAERVKLLRGTLNIASVPGKGTTVSIIIPLPDHKKEA